jgi:hypothetical protein
MSALASIKPAPPAPPAESSIALWIWFAVALAVVVIGGYMLASRR